jgi:hypothetical protein
MKTKKVTTPVHIDVKTHARIVTYTRTSKPGQTLGEAIDELVRYALARKAALAKHAAKSRVRR